MAIRGYKGKKTKQFAAGEHVAEFERCKLAVQKGLTKLQAATALTDLRNPPSNKFEALRGDRSGQYSIRINDRYRICFKWIPFTEASPDNALHVPGEPDDVEITDYH